MMRIWTLALMAALPGPDVRQETPWPDADWRILEAKVRWAVAHRLDTLPLGRAIAALGETFVGARYTPRTLEVPGPERVVVNLQEFDCVTFVENLLAMTRFIRQEGVAGLADRRAAERRYAGYLQELRYRGGRLDGYPSRLHYFSEWLSDNAARGNLVLLTERLGGLTRPGALFFMSAHPRSYRQMADPAVREAIRAREASLNAGPARWYVPEDRIGAVERRIEDGDIIAATSTLPGLDVAHTGIALWKNGRLHLLHAPLVGTSVEISTLPLAERIRSIETQDGIMVGRPAEVHDHAAMAGMGPVVVPPGVLYTEADVRFMQGMIAHHAQAIHMSRMAEKRGANPRVLRLAVKIDQSQIAEIALMQEWLRAHGQETPDTSSWRSMEMPGMLTAGQLATLDSARGPEFDRRFLILMIQHHQGALQMVADLLASPRAAQDVDISVLANDIHLVQTAEIGVMRQMLAELLNQ